MPEIRRGFFASLAVAAILLGLSLPIQAQQRYPIENRAEWQEVGRYNKMHVIDAGDIPGHQIRISEIQRIYNDKSKLNVSGIRVLESVFWGYSDNVRGVGKAWGYGAWILEDGNRVFIEYSGTIQSTPDGSGGLQGIYHGTSRLTGGTGQLKGIRGTMTDKVEFSTSNTSGYNRSSGNGEYWFQE